VEGEEIGEIGGAGSVRYYGDPKTNMIYVKLGIERQ
jgi:hypothetical protein